VDSEFQEMWMSLINEFHRQHKRCAQSWGKQQGGESAVVTIAIYIFFFFDLFAVLWPRVCVCVYVCTGRRDCSFKHRLSMPFIDRSRQSSMME
jgi:hypothetical protein